MIVLNNECLLSLNRFCAFRRKIALFFLNVSLVLEVLSMLENVHTLNLDEILSNICSTCKIVKFSV